MRLEEVKMSTLGAIFNSLSKSVPAAAQSFDDAKKAKEEAEMKRIQTLAALESLQQDTKNNEYKQSQLEKADAETASKKEAAKTAFHKYTTDIGSMNQAQDIGGTEGMKEGGYAGPLNPEYKKTLANLSGMTPVQQQTEYNLPYHAASDEGIKNTVDQANKDATLEYKKNNPSGGGASVYTLKKQDLAAIRAMPEGPEKEAAFDDFILNSATGQAYSLSDVGIDKAVKKAAAVESGVMPARAETEKAKVKAKSEAETDANYNALPGFRPIPGIKITDDSVTKVKSISPDVETMKILADELIKKYETMGSVFTGNDAADYTSKVRNLQLLAKSPALYNLGVLTGPDLSLLEQSIPNPASIKEGVKKQVLGDLSVKLKNFRNLIDTRSNNFYKSNGFEQIKPQTIREFATEAEAEAAGLQPKTKIKIAGRPATWR